MWRGGALRRSTAWIAPLFLWWTFCCCLPVFSTAHSVLFAGLTSNVAVVATIWRGLGCVSCRGYFNGRGASSGAGPFWLRRMKTGLLFAPEREGRYRRDAVRRQTQAAIFWPAYRAAYAGALLLLLPGFERLAYWFLRAGALKLAVLCRNARRTLIQAAACQLLALQSPPLFSLRAYVPSHYSRRISPLLFVRMPTVSATPVGASGDNALLCR